MRQSNWRWWILLASVWALAATAHATQPTPSPKPLADGHSVSFVEGVDSPRAKPEAAASPVVKAPDVPPFEASCEISGAQFVRREPVSGGLEGGPTDDEACGIGNPVGLRGIGVDELAMAFPSPVLVSCAFAQTVSDWLREDVAPAAQQHMASPLVKVGSGPGYQCRRRNNLPDGKLSDHALGKALDITHFEFADGATISIADDWDKDTAKGRFLKAIHAAACDRFTTVLGPDADPNHRSHFHLDIGCHGQNCTYVICQ